MAQDTQKAAATAMLIGVCIFVLALYYIRLPDGRVLMAGASSIGGMPAPALHIYRATIAVDAAPVRELPGPQAKIVSRLAQDSPVELVERRQGWFYVVGTRGASGWLPFAALNIDGSVPPEISLTPDDGDPQSLPKLPRRPGAPRRQTGETGGPPVRCRSGQNSIDPKRHQTCFDQAAPTP